MHNARMRRHGNVNYAKYNYFHDEKCSIPSCNNKHCAKNLCFFHYKRKISNISFDLPRREKSINGKCEILGCDKEYHAKGYCHIHYIRYSNVRTRDKDLYLQIAKTNVRKRDKWSCKWYNCDKNIKNRDNIHVHHIFPTSEYPEYKYLEEYMICYCADHHREWHEARGDRYHKYIHDYKNVMREEGIT